MTNGQDQKCVQVIVFPPSANSNSKPTTLIIWKLFFCRKHLIPNLESKCRLCLSDKAIVQSIFECDSKETTDTLVDKIFECTAIMVITDPHNMLIQQSLLVLNIHSSSHLLSYCISFPRTLTFRRPFARIARSSWTNFYCSEQSVCVATRFIGSTSCTNQDFSAEVVDWNRRVAAMAMVRRRIRTITWIENLPTTKTTSNQ